MKWLKNLLRWLYCLYAYIVFVMIMISVLPAVIAGSFFGKIDGGNFIYGLCSMWGDLWFFFIGIRHRNIYEVPHDKKQQYIFVANHISYLDAPIIVTTLRQPVRVLGKVEMSKMPVFGYIYRNTVVTVDRSSAENRARSVRVLKSVIKKGISIFIFPEGTFNETHQPVKDFFDGAFRIAIETQTPIKPVLFLDAYARMHYKSVLTINPGRSRSVFLEPIPVAGLTSKDLPALKQKVYQVMEAKLKEYQADWIQAQPVTT
ncbi:lysophospholipid acyltransferase family protein [Paraflavitalea sp. CAU 1676]|uniref:lysophospholipid acyltransferase family protein n=1 Tax=Paraflavitalea sp. CAU 1676 TaxID=3032598 RepID=UPI0023DA26DF|nr:lysophospholipid acyltransferase family protein [Paraflavitalea sp. CAU 1676]MDF2188800.1 lysophospholipid acyltransferase family protein [Paraflavitalea sp. CAU 1676]